jgi:hydrogenase maturation protein HypF
MAVSHLYAAYGREFQKEAGFFTERFEKGKLSTIVKMIEAGMNSPLTSSCGRLFDAVASLTGIKDTVTFEAEGAVLLEKCASRDVESIYPFEFHEEEINTVPIIKAVVEDMKKGADIAVISASFHNAVVEIIIEAVRRMNAATGIGRVVLSGGVFQNRRILDSAVDGLEPGFEVFFNESVPPNDGGLSLGQAIVAWERAKHVSRDSGKGC